MTAVSKAAPGRYFEDFALDEEIVHPLPRTVTAADGALYLALTGSRFAINAADTVAVAHGHPRAPIDDVLAFHLVFGKTVPDISLNAVANLGYAEVLFRRPLYPGDTISARSTVIGRKPNRDGKTGVVWVHSRGLRTDGDVAIEFKRWVMVNRRTEGDAAAGPTRIPDLPDRVDAAHLPIPEGFRCDGADPTATGEPWLWGDYAVGEKLDHRDGMTIEEAEHQSATRLYHNTARVHFDRLLAERGRFGKRIVYGGHVISLARALSITGLANAQHVVAIEAGRHTAPCFAGDVVFAWSEVLDKIEIPGRSDIGALRLRTIAVKNREAGDFPDVDADGKTDPSVVLDLTYVVLMPR